MVDTKNVNRISCIQLRYCGQAGMGNNQNQNMTITADEDVLRWIRVRAAESRTSASRLAGEILRERMQRERGYFLAKRRYLSVKARVISQDRYPGREDLHNR